MNHPQPRQFNNRLEPIDNPGYLDAQTMDRLALLTQELKQRITGLLRLGPGHRVLDVGCGPGTDTIPMSEQVGDSGTVIGVDYDKRMITEADSRAKKAKFPERLRHEVADGSFLPFDSDTFDACRSERLLQHVIDGEAVVKEIVRVTKPSGRIVIADTDWG